MKDIHYTRIGTGTPILFVNGLYQRRESWEPITQSLSEHFECITFDFPNQNMRPNRSAAAPTFDDPEQFENYILEVLRAFDLVPEETMICGLSFGASLVRNLHFTKGVNFKRIALLGLYSAEFLEFHKQLTSEMREILEKYGSQTYIGLMVFWYFSHKWISQNPLGSQLIKMKFKELFTNEESVHALFRAHEREYSRGVPDGTFRCPSLLINSEEDVLCLISEMEKYAALVGAEFATVPGGHVLIAESPAQTADLLRSIFLVEEEIKEMELA